jgi:hypothetical protein
MVLTVGLIGMDTLWKGNYSDLQMAEAYCVGQFVRLKTNIGSPRFEWQRKKGGALATGRISQILPNGCLVVKFPGKFSLGEVYSCLADPSEVELMSFGKCGGIVKGVFVTALLLVLLLCSTECLSNRLNFGNSALKKNVELS